MEKEKRVSDLLYWCRLRHDCKLKGTSSYGLQCGSLDSEISHLYDIRLVYPRKSESDSPDQQM